MTTKIADEISHLEFEIAGASTADQLRSVEKPVLELAARYDFVRRELQKPVALTEKLVGATAGILASFYLYTGGGRQLEDALREITREPLIMIGGFVFSVFVVSYAAAKLAGLVFSNAYYAMSPRRRSLYYQVGRAASLQKALNRKMRTFYMGD